MLDLLGAFAYIIMFFGHYLLTKGNSWGWLFRMQGGILWIVIGALGGWWSIVFGSIVFLLIDFVGLRRSPSSEPKKNNDIPLVFETATTNKVTVNEADVKNYIGKAIDPRKVELADRKLFREVCLNADKLAEGAQRAKDHMLKSLKVDLTTPYGSEFDLEGNDIEEAIMRGDRLPQPAWMMRIEEEIKMPPKKKKSKSEIKGLDGPKKRKIVKKKSTKKVTKKKVKK